MSFDLNRAGPLEVPEPGALDKEAQRIILSMRERLNEGENILEDLQQLLPAIRAQNFEGGRELQLAITNIEQGLLWLKEAMSKP